MMDIVDRLESLGASLNNSYSRQKTLNDASKEIQTLRAKVDVLVEALREIVIHDDSEGYICEKIARKALAPYDKISEVKHDTK